MGKINKPRSGSLQFWPRVRAKRSYPRIRSYKNKDDINLCGFIGYKVGMTHILFKDERPNSLTKGDNVMWPVTVIECPPLKVYSLRFYKKTNNGLRLISEIFNKNVTKELVRKVKPSKKENKEVEFDELRLVAYTQPRLIKIGKKKPDIVEFYITGKNKEEILKFGKEILSKDIKVGDVLKEGVLVDVRGVSKGKGFQGTVKRYGVKILQHKSEKKKRGIGTLGSWHPAKVPYTVAQPGKMGYHSRTEYNKLILRISNKADDINVKGGFVRYGLVKSDYVLLKGSVVGSVKRPIILTNNLRERKISQPSIEYISLRSNQGR